MGAMGGVNNGVSALAVFSSYMKARGTVFTANPERSRIVQINHYLTSPLAAIKQCPTIRARDRILATIKLDLPTPLDGIKAMAEAPVLSKPQVNVLR